MLWILCALPLFLFANEEKLVLGSEEFSNTTLSELFTKEIDFETSVPIRVACSYPIFQGNGLLIECVNHHLKTEAETHFDSHLREEVFSDEIMDDACVLSYDFFPIYQTPNLITVYGCDFQCRFSHGSARHEGKNFWRVGDSVVNLAVNDLFIKDSDWCDFLLSYCDHQYRSIGYGYYSDPDLMPELQPHDLETFLLTERGVVIIFSSYRVGSFAEGPHALLIPYDKLVHFIDPNGPLKDIVM